MSLIIQVSNLATATGTLIKDTRAWMGPLASLATTNKSSLVQAINEVKTVADAAMSSGGATTLDGLNDVAVVTPATGHVLRFNGTTWVNVLGSSFFDPVGSASAAQAASQPLDSDLTSIAALTTTAYGRDLLTLANQAALAALIPTATESNAGLVELATTAEAVAGADTARAVTPAGVSAAINNLVGGAPGLLDTLDEIAQALGDDPNFAGTITTSLAGKQPIDADLTAIAALTSAANKMPYSTGTNAWAMADLTSFGRSLNALADAAAGRTLLDVYSKAEIGTPETDFVAVLDAALL